MIRKFLIIFGFFLLLGFPAAFSQNIDTGFFLVIENQENCTHLVHVVTGPITYCVPNNPVISKTEFTFVGDLKLVKGYELSSIDLRLTPEGFKTLETLTVNLPNTKLALVLEDHVVGIFDSKGVIRGSILPVTGKVNSPEMEWLYNRVKKSRL